MKLSLNTWEHILGKKLSIAGHPHMVAPTGDVMVHKGGGVASLLSTFLLSPLPEAHLPIPTLAGLWEGIQGVPLPPFKKMFFFC